MAQFAVTGTAVIEKIKISSAAQKQLRNIVIKIDTDQVIKELNKINQRLKKAFAPLAKLSQAGGGLNRVANGLRNVSSAAAGANKNVKKTEALLLSVVRKASAFRVSTIAINSFFNVISGGLRFLIEFDSRLRNINKILRLNDRDLTSFGDRLIQVAKDFNLAAEEVADAARTAAQAGLAGVGASENERTAATLQLISKAAIAAASSTLEFGQAVESLLTIQKQLGVTTSEASVVLSKFAAIEDAAAVDAQGLSVVFQKAGTSIGLAFGNSVDKATGAIAALLERTRQTPQVVGTFFKTLSARLSGANKDAIEAIRTAGQGISLTDAFGNLKDPIELLSQLKEELKGLSDIETGEILGKVFGIRQAELGKALIATLGETGRAVELTEAAQGSYLTQILKVEEEQDKFAAQLNRVVQGFNQFVNALRDDAFAPFIDFITKSGEAMTDWLGGIKNVTSGVGALLSTLALFGGGKILQFLTKGGGGGASIGARLGAGIANIFPSNRDRVAPEAGPRQGFVSRATKAAGKNLQAFSAKAFIASASLSILTSNAKEAAQGQGEFIEGLASAGDTFAKFLILGPKAALMAAAIDASVSVFKWISSSLLVIAGDLDEAAKKLRKQGDVGGAEAIERQAEGTKISRDAGGARGAALAQQFSALISDVRSQIRSDLDNVLNTSEVDKTLSTTASRLKQFKERLKDVSFKELTEFRKLSPGSVEALEGTSGGASVLGKPEFLAEFDKETGALIGKIAAAYTRRIDQLEIRTVGDFLKSTLGPLLGQRQAGGGIATGVNVQAVLEEVARELEFNSQALEAFDRGLVTGGEDPTIAKRKDKERVANDALAASIDNLLISEIKLFGARSGTNLQAVQALTFLEEERARKTLATAKAERELIKARELRSITQAIESEQFKKDQGDRIIATGTQGGFSQDEINRVRKDTKAASDELFRLTTNLQAAKAAVGNLESVQAATVKVAAAELGLTSVRLQGLKTLQDAYEATKVKQLNFAKSLLTAQVGLQSAEQALSNFETDASGEDIARQRLQQERVLQTIALDNLDKQIALQHKLSADAVQARKDVESAIANLKIQLEKTPTGEGGDKLKKGIGEQEALLARRADLEKVNNEKAIDLINNRTIAEVKGRTKILGLSLAVLKADEQAGQDRLSAANAMIKSARSLKDAVKGIFEAQVGLTNAIRSKLAEAGDEIKSKRGGLDQAFSELASARSAMISALSGAAGAQADYAIAVNSAAVAADKVLGKFFGLRDEASALAQAYDAAIEGAQAMGASEQKLTELRQQAAEQQLSLYQQLLSDTQSKAESFFTSSAEDRQGFVQGLAALQNVSGQFGGDIENFRGLDEGALNQFGGSLIALPQDIRQNMIKALDQLPDGVGIGGLSSDELKEILLGGALGESEEVGIERLSTTMETVADLTRQVADLQTAQLSASNQSLIAANEQLVQARENVTIAQNMLSQAREDALGIQRGIAEVTSTINTQIGQYREEFKNEAAIIAASIKDPEQRQVALQAKLAEFIGKVSEITGGAASQVSTLRGDSEVERRTERIPGQFQGGPAGDVIKTFGIEISNANAKLGLKIDGLRHTISTDFTSGMNKNIEAINNLATQLIDLGTNGEKVNAQITIDNNQEIEIKGIPETVTAVMAAIEARGFVTPEQLNSLRATIEEMLKEGVANGSYRGNIALPNNGA